jgi:hypothetical protein
LLFSPLGKIRVNVIIFIKRDDLSLRFHPDKCRGGDCQHASEKMALMTEAKETLLEQVHPSHFFS